MAKIGSKTARGFPKDSILLGKVWEDCRLLTKGLNIQHEDRVLSITG